MYHNGGEFMWELKRPKLAFGQSKIIKMNGTVKSEQAFGRIVYCFGAKILCLTAGCMW